MKNLSAFKQIISEQIEKTLSEEFHQDLHVNHTEITKMHPDSKKAFDKLYKIHRKAIESGQAGISARLSKPDATHGYHDLEINVGKFKKGATQSSNHAGTQVAGSSDHDQDFSIIHHKSLNYVKSKYGNHYTKAL